MRHKDSGSAEMYLPAPPRRRLGRDQSSHRQTKAGASEGFPPRRLCAAAAGQSDNGNYCRTDASAQPTADAGIAVVALPSHPCEAFPAVNHATHRTWYLLLISVGPAAPDGLRKSEARAGARNGPTAAPAQFEASRGEQP